jgi:vacuolar-type H+-ATPase subunit D/Vma8
MREQQPTDRALVDLRDQRDHLRIQLSLMKDSQQPTAAEIVELQRQLEIVDRRIANHSPAPPDV